MTRIALVELREELLHIRRDPAALFFSIAMPVGFFALTVGLFGDRMDLAGVAAYGAFAAMFATCLNPGVGLAEARESGWLRVKQAGGTPVWASLLARVVAAVPYAAGTLVALLVTAATFGGVRFGVGEAAGVVVALVLGSLPFALLGLAAGAVLRPNAATAALNAVLFPMVVAAGLWFPLELLPGPVQRVAPWLPARHLADLAAATVDGTSLLPHAAALLATAVVTAALAAAAYRSSHR